MMHREGVVLKKEIFKNLAGATLLAASLLAGAQPVELIQEAEQGNAKAQYKLGEMLATGQGVPQNEAEAVKWFRLAAQQGHVDAQYNLGMMLVNGEGVPQNDAEAVKWYRLAAQQGDAYAQYNLGVMLEMGRGVPQNDVEASKWYQLAAQQGYAAAQNNLGVKLALGKGVTRSPKQAYFWALLAAAQVEKYKKNRDIVVKQLNAKDRNEMQASASEWTPKVNSPR